MIVVEGKLTGKGRPRFYRGHAVTPKITRDYEKRVVNCYLAQSGVLYETPVRVNIIAYKKIPKSYTKKRINLIQQGIEQPVSKPDIDNICKIILDALNGVAYKDDTQVIRLAISKKYTEGIERIEFEIKEYKIWTNG